MMKERILVVDDDEKIIAMLRRNLAFEGYQVDTASNGSEALKFLVHNEEPHLVILDVMMPQIDGWEVCRRLREAGSHMPILMLTAKDEIADRVYGLDNGADDYLVKPFALEELLARIRVLLRRKPVEASNNDPVLTFDDIKLLPAAREVFRGERKIELTTKEFDVLYLFIQNPKRVLSRDMLMEKIWGIDFSGESNVLEVYIAMLRQKLEEQGEYRCIQTVRGAGYVLRKD
jgi:two-component system response regulator MprA